MNAISKMLLGGPLDLDVLRNAEQSTLILIDNPCRQYSSFALRLLAATVIATAGVAAGLCYDIIGAMLVAPLMSPMLGHGARYGPGPPACRHPCAADHRCGHVPGGFGICGAHGGDSGGCRYGDQFPGARPRVPAFGRSSSSRSASGFVAALASVRSDIPDAVPGIAISASIVPPPVAWWGAALYEGAPDAALGAFLLFINQLRCHPNYRSGCVSAHGPRCASVLECGRAGA